MIKIENFQVFGWDHVIRGMRNPMNSWDKSDSIRCAQTPDAMCLTCEERHTGQCCDGFILGRNDLDLMLRLAKAGSVDGKFRRMITVYVDITAPLYWWKEFDTYKVGTVANSCSTMHKIHAKEFSLDDFSCEHLDIRMRKMLEDIVNTLNDYRTSYVNYNANDFEVKGCPGKKLIWWQMIQLLPSSYNQKRTVMLNYEVLANIYQYRRRHKLDEWRKLCQWIEGLPYSEIITCNVAKTLNKPD